MVFFYETLFEAVFKQFHYKQNCISIVYKLQRCIYIQSTIRKMTVYIDSFMVRCVFAGLNTSLVAVLPTARVTRSRGVSVRCDHSQAVSYALK
jgi:hypothetical protein